MTSLISVAGTGTWYVICITVLILCVGTLSTVFRCVRDGRNKATLVISILNFVLITALVIVLMDLGHYLHSFEENEYTLFQMSLFETVSDTDVLKELEQIDISNLTPLDALNTLYRLQTQLKNRWSV